MQFNIGAARKHWDYLVAAVERGEEVVLARNGKPVAKIVRDETPNEIQRGLARIDGGLESMPSQATTETHQATGVIPVAPWRLRALSVLPQWQLAVTFNDGLTGIVDLSVLVHGPDAGVFEALRDPAFFAQACLDYGAVTWPNGADIAPDAMHKELRRNGMWRILD